MAAADTSIIRTILTSAGLILAYGISFWRIFRSNSGDKFIECSSITVMAFVVTMAAWRIPHFPDWAKDFLMVLVYGLTLFSVFFGLQQVYRALRRRKAH